jgi:PelA/Pel-15E family pectate lyase
MSNRARSFLIAALLVTAAMSVSGQAQATPDRAKILDAMKRATSFMVDKVSTNGGYVWTYLPDLSRRWGEMEARESMIWIQPPGTASMGHLFLDAYHATGDEYYYAATEKVAGALIWAQLPAGGWNYVADFGGDRALREWYDTIGKNGWRLEEFQHYWGNATFDDAGTAESAKLLLRLYVEKRDPKYKPALDKALQFVLDSQYPIGAWPQRYPLQHEFAKNGKPDYTSFATFNDDVAKENLDFLVMYYQAVGDPRVLDPIVRGMSAFIVMQQGPPQAGWALQYTLDLKPSGARTYEPNSLVTHTTATNIELLLKFYQLTGDTKFIARVPEALDWLDSVKVAPDVAPLAGGRTHPTFIELGTNKPLYVHRTGSNVVNGRYYVDYDPHKTLGHYGAFRKLDVAGLRKQYQALRVMTAEEVTKDSPLRPGAGVMPLPRFFAVGAESKATLVASVLESLNATGFWPAPLGYNSNPYKGPGSPTVASGDFSTTHVGDDTDTSPYPDPKLTGISTEAYIRNMGVLIRQLTRTN